MRSYNVFSSLKTAWTTIFSNTYMIGNKVKNQLCPIFIKAITDIKENL